MDDLYDDDFMELRHSRQDGQRRRNQSGPLDRSNSLERDDFRDQRRRVNQQGRRNQGRGRNSQGQQRASGWRDRSDNRRGRDTSYREGNCQDRDSWHCRGRDEVFRSERGGRNRDVDRFRDDDDREGNYREDMEYQDLSDETWQNRPVRDGSGRYRDEQHGQGSQGRQSRSRDRSPRDGGQNQSRGVKRNRSPVQRDLDSDRNRFRSPDRNAAKEERWDRWKANSKTNVVMLTGLPTWTRDSDVNPLIQPFKDQVKKMEIVRYTGRNKCKGYGFVIFHKQSDAERWIEETQGVVFMERTELSLYFSSFVPKEDYFTVNDATSSRRSTRVKSDIKTNTVMLTGLPHDTEEADVYPLLFPYHARVKDVRIIRLDGKCRGFGFVDFISEDDAENWMGKSKTVTMRDQVLYLEYAKTSNRAVKHSSGHDPGWIKYVTVEPRCNLVIWNIPKDVDRLQIEQTFAGTEYNLKFCRVLFDRGTGVSRGFGFLDFGDVASAEKWYNDSKGILMVNGKIIVAAYSSGSKDNRTPWICSRCGTDNFKTRESCFKCAIPRKESENSSNCIGGEEVGTNPCNTLIFRGLDALTTEENLNRALQWTTGMFCKNVLIMRDPLTKVSMSYAFGEMPSITEAKKVLDFLTTSGTPLEVDGKQILVSFAKNTYNTIMATRVNQSESTLQDARPQRQKSSEKASVAAPQETSPAETSVEETTISRTSVSPKKDVRKKKKAVVNNDAKEKKVNYLQLNLVPLKGYLYDPKEDKYYNAKILNKCPVNDCGLKKAHHWMRLRKHWVSIHIPTKKAYLCPLNRCKSSSKTYTTVNLFYRHLDSHKDLKEHEYEQQLAKAKVKLLPNQNFRDPGSATLPPPTLAEGPKINIPETKCPVTKCPHSYTTLDSMKQHWAQYHSSHVTMYHCGVCDTIDRDRKLMTVHVNEKHYSTDAVLEKVVLESKQYIDPGNVVPFWSLYSKNNDNGEEENWDETDDKEIEKRLGETFPVMKIPDAGNDPEDLCEFLTWTERYMQRLQNVQKGAMRDLQKLVQRKLDEESQL